MKNRYSKKDKTLITLFKISEGKKKPVHYEDLLVESFISFKNDFQLKKYPDYPDSDVFRYIIYFQLKPAGFIRIANKQCMLTDLGIDECKKLLGEKYDTERTELTQPDKEIQRLIHLPGFIMYQGKKHDKIIDQDFFDFYKSSVRTKPLELLGNINQIDSSIVAYMKTNKRISKTLQEYSVFLRNSFIHLLEGIKK